LSNKIKNLMAGGRSRLEKDKKAAPKNKSKQHRIKVQPIAKSDALSEQLSEPLKPQQEKEKEVSVAVPPQPSNASYESSTDDINLNNLTPQMRESLRIVMKNNISPECMQAIEAMSSENKDFMPSFIKLGPRAMAAFCNIARDEDYVITTKIKLITLLNRVSRNEIVHKIFRRVGAAIEALRRLKDLLLLQ
jgi:hypothetical protein